MTNCQPGQTRLRITAVIDNTGIGSLNQTGDFLFELRHGDIIKYVVNIEGKMRHGSAVYDKATKTLTDCTPLQMQGEGDVAPRK